MSVLGKKCEGCGEPATGYDPDDVPLCSVCGSLGDEDEDEEVTVQIELKAYSGEPQRLREMVPDDACFAIYARNEVTGRILRKLLEAMAEGRLQLDDFIEVDED